MVDYIVNGTVTLSDTAVASANVLIRNDRTNDYASVTTNSTGKFMYSLNNLTSGWTVGDMITCVCNYTTYKVESSHTILAGEGGHTFTLALAAITVGSLNYCSIQDVYDYLGLISTSTLISSELINGIGLRVEDQIERRCNTIFHDNDGSYTTVTTEYHDVRNAYQRYFFLRKRPVIAFTTLEVNVASDDNATGSWTDVTDDCKTDADTGRVDIIATGVDGPVPGTKMFRATYTYGFAAVPEEIKQLTVLMIVRELMRSNLAIAVIEGRSEFTAPQAELLNEQIEEIFSRWTQHNLVNV